MEGIGGEGKEMEGKGMDSAQEGSVPLEGAWCSRWVDQQAAGVALAFDGW